MVLSRILYIRLHAINYDDTPATGPVYESLVTGCSDLSREIARYCTES